MKTSYRITSDDVNMLMGILSVPTDMRGEVMRLSLDGRSRDSIIELFAQFIGMCVSVEENATEMVEDYLVMEGIKHPCSYLNMNTPSLFGALMGIGNTVEPTEGMCGGCAFRLGTKANQARITSIDAKDCSEDGDRFSCHEDLQDNGEPSRVCAGWAKKCAESGTFITVK